MARPETQQKKCGFKDRRCRRNYSLMRKSAGKGSQPCAHWPEMGKKCENQLKDLREPPFPSQAWKRIIAWTPMQLLTGLPKMPRDLFPFIQPWKYFATEAMDEAGPGHSLGCQYILQYPCDFSGALNPKTYRVKCSYQDFQGKSGSQAELC